MHFGVVVSQLCAAHNDGCDVPAESIFDLPPRIAKLLIHLRRGKCDKYEVVHSERSASDAELTRCGVTSRAYLRHIKQLTRHMQRSQKDAEKWSAGSEATCEYRYLDKDSTTVFTATSETAARSAVGATLEATERVFHGAWRHAFACIRPPGHHNGCSEFLEQRETKGYLYACHGGCVFNETAVAVRHAQQLAAVSSESAVFRVAVVDIDVHFGDGTALTFYDDASVLHLSVHLDQSDKRMFPFLVGKAEERGVAAGRGFTINLPLSEGTADAEAYEIFARCGLPALRLFQPRMIFLSCGFDGMLGDPAGANMLLTANFYGQVAAACAKMCSVVATLQGGYDAENVCQGTESVLRALYGDWEGPVASAEAGAVDMGAIRAIEAKLGDESGWWELETSFEHGLQSDSESS
jgi:acetoin utilization deacetylase AcuC-like enzyme